jgi:hypothetical protein
LRCLGRPWEKFEDVHVGKYVRAFGKMYMLQALLGRLVVMVGEFWWLFAALRKVVDSFVPKS